MLGWLYPFVIHGRSAAAVSLRRRALGLRCYVDTGVTITEPRHLETGAGCALYHGVHIVNTKGHVRLGDRSHFGPYCVVNAPRGCVSIGDDVAIGPHTVLVSYSNGYGAGQRVTDLRVQADIQIGNNVFIGAHCTVLPGATIEDNVVIGAGSVVRGHLASGGVYVGAPSRRVREIADSHTLGDLPS